MFSDGLDVWHSGRCQKGRGLSWAVWAGQSRSGMLVGFARPLVAMAAPHYLSAHYQASIVLNGFKSVYIYH